MFFKDSRVAEETGLAEINLEKKACFHGNRPFFVSIIKVVESVKNEQKKTTASKKIGGIETTCRYGRQGRWQSQWRNQPKRRFRRKEA